MEKLRTTAYNKMIDLAEKPSTSIKKKIWHQTVNLLHEEYPKASLGVLTGLFGYSKQSYYNRSDNDDFAKNAIKSLIVEKARNIETEESICYLSLITDAYSRKIVG